MLFNLHRAMQTSRNHVIVVEGFFDALKIHQAGHPAVVALMGSSFSQRQSELLLCYFAGATLCHRSRPVPGSQAPPLAGSPLGKRREELHAESIV